MEIELEMWGYFMLEMFVVIFDFEVGDVGKEIILGYVLFLLGIIFDVMVVDVMDI